MPGHGSGYQHREPASDAGAGSDNRGTRQAAGDSLRQRTGVHQPVFSRVVHGAGDRVGAHSAGKAESERLRGEFSRQLRDECLNVSWFENLCDARRKIAAWRVDYNQERPHSSLGYRTPAEFAR